MIRYRATGLVLALVLVLVGAACSGDDGDGDGGGDSTTTETTVDDGTTTAPDGATTTLPDETTTTAAPPVAGPAELQDRLVAPEQVGEGFTPDPTLGNGAFSGELCEDVTLEATWDDQASQALTLGEGDDGQLVTQAVLDFADEEAATAFVQAAVDGNVTCLPDGEPQDADAGDEAVVIDVESGPTSSSLAIVRVGSLATVFTALYPTAAGNLLTPELLSSAAAALG